MPKSPVKSPSASKTKKAKKGEKPVGRGAHKPVTQTVDTTVAKASPKPAAKAPPSGTHTAEVPPGPVHNGNTRFNFAFPFSKIEVVDPSSELIELTTLLSDLVTALSEWVPGERLVDLRARTEALLARLTA